MMDLHKWERLYEIDPTLEPPEFGWFENPDSASGSLCVRDIYLPGWYSRGVGPLHEDDAAALIRDRAVIVGGEKWRFNLVWAGRTYRDDRPDGWQVYCKQKLLVQKPDPLEALYFAWCKVLGVEP